MHPIIVVPPQCHWTSCLRCNGLRTAVQISQLHEKRLSKMERKMEHFLFLLIFFCFNNHTNNTFFEFNIFFDRNRLHRDMCDSFCLNFVTFFTMAFSFVVILFYLDMCVNQYVLSYVFPFSSLLTLDTIHTHTHVDREKNK